MNSGQKTHLVFNNSFVNTLPVDPITDTYPRQVENATFSVAMPKKVSSPKTLVVSTEIANLIGFDQTEALFKALENILSDIETDMTIFYRLLASFNLNLTHSVETANNELVTDHFSSCFYDKNQVTTQYVQPLVLWLTQYATRFEQDSNTNREASMNKVNPKYVLRNYLSQLAIDKAEAGDYSELHALHEFLKNPYDEQPELEHYFCKRPEWAKNKAGCSMLSCSS